MQGVADGKIISGCNVIAWPRGCVCSWWVTPTCTSASALLCTANSMLCSCILLPAEWTTAMRSCMVLQHVIKHLQVVLNAIVRLITGVPLGDKIATIFRDYIALATHRLAHWIQDCADDFQLHPVHGTSPASFHGICCPFTSVEGHVMLRSANYG